MARIKTSGFRLGRCTVLPALNRIVGPNGAVRVEPKAMQVLAHLAERSGDTVLRSDLMERVWPATSVTEDVLTRCVGLLRGAFQKCGSDSEVIETIPTRGYRITQPAGPISDIDSSMLQSRPFAPFLRPFPLAGTAVIVLAALIWILTPGSSRSTSSPLRPIPGTTSPGLEVHPALSPNGKRLAFIGQGTGRDEWDLFLRDIESGLTSKLTTDGSFKGGTCWSPDGSRIAFVRREAGCSIWALNVAAGDETQLSRCGEGGRMRLSWSGNGRWLAFSEGPRLGPAAIVLLEISTGETRKLTSPPDSFSGDDDPAFSPDSGSLAFVRGETAASEDLFLLGLESGDLRRLTNDRAAISGVTWDPRSRRLFFSSDRSGDQLLWEIGAEGGTPKWTPIEDRQIFEPRIARQHPVLSYSRRSLDTNLWWTDSSGSDPTRLEASTHVERDPAFSPAGNRLAFVSNRSGQEQIWIREPDTLRAKPVTSLPDSLVRSPSWSPNGDFIAFEAMTNGNRDIYTVRVDRRTVRRLTDWPSDEGTPTWANDSSWLFFRSNRAGQSQIWKVRASGNRSIQVTHNGGWRAQECFHGRRLCYSKPEAPGLWRRPLDGSGDEEAFLPDLAPRDLANWTATSSGIYYIARQGESTRLRYYDSESHESTTVTRFEGLIGSSAFSVSPESGRIAFTRLDRSESDIMLVPDFPRR